MGEWSASRPDRFTPGEMVAGTHSIRGWVGPRAALDAVGKRRNPSPFRESNPGRPVRSLVTILTELTRLRHIKVKVKSVSFLPEYHAMKAYWGMEV
jgi:hypothetical protein